MSRLSLKDADELLSDHLTKLNAEGGETARSCHFIGPEQPAKEFFVDLDCWDVRAHLDLALQCLGSILGRVLACSMQFASILCAH